MTGNVQSVHRTGPLEGKSNNWNHRLNSNVRELLMSSAHLLICLAARLNIMFGLVWSTLRAAAQPVQAEAPSTLRSVYFSKTSVPRQAYQLSELKSRAMGKNPLRPTTPGRLRQLKSAAIFSLQTAWRWC